MRVTCRHRVAPECSMPREVTKHKWLQPLQGREVETGSGKLRKNHAGIVPQTIVASPCQRLFRSRYGSAAGRRVLTYLCAFYIKNTDTHVEGVVKVLLIYKTSGTGWYRQGKHWKFGVPATSGSKVKGTREATKSHRSCTGDSPGASFFLPQTHNRPHLGSNSKTGKCRSRAGAMGEEKLRLHGWQIKPDEGRQVTPG
jgi:hypothetical protein